MLLSPIYIAMCFLGLFRAWQCCKHGVVFEQTKEKKIYGIIKTACSLCNIFANIVLVSVIKQGAPYEYLVYPLGAIGWIGVLCTNIINLKYFSFRGQWIPRFLGLWVFICFCIRWPSQYALGSNIAGQEYYFQAFLAMWVPQAICVIVFYFEKAVTEEEWLAQAPSIVVREEEETAPSDPKGNMAFRASDMKADELNAATTLTTPEGYTKLTRSEETAMMQSVPWTDSKNPEGNAIFLSRLLFSWMSPLFSFAHKNNIEDYDVWDLRPGLR